MRSSPRKRKSFMSKPERDKPLYVTRPFLPPLEECLPYFEQIWESRVLTNRGPLHDELERALAEYLGVEHLSLFANGTLALITAFQALRIGGEVVTTPFSFAATAHSLLWNGMRPVFADIREDGYNLDPDRIEAVLTPQTTAILAVHCYGNPCDTERIQQVADRHGLKVIYDAAHAFGVRRNGETILRQGDLSVLSFHATKVFNTFEGGAIVCRDAEMKRRIDFLKNFGFADEVTIVAPGINGKMNELQAAIGLMQLKHMPEVTARRRRIDALYRELLAGAAGITCLATGDGVEWNYAYFPVRVGAGAAFTRDGLYHRLREHEVYARRYFFPLISEMPMYRDLPSAAPEGLPFARRASEEILCLPIFPEMTDEDARRVAELITE